jgi:hypothetical protein
MALDDIAKDLANATSADLAELVTRLGNDLEHLRTLAETAGSSAHTMATTLMLRAHNLIVTATEMLIAMPDV